MDFFLKWVFNPDGEGCGTCQDASGQIYDTEPDRPHPNCECEIREVYVDEDDNIIDESEETCEEEESGDVSDTYFLNKDYIRIGADIDIDKTFNSSELEGLIESELDIVKNLNFSHDEQQLNETHILEPGETEDDLNPSLTITWSYTQNVCRNVEGKVTSNDVKVSFSDFDFSWY
ncbi:hypothetical protein [Polaribacter butkevichii]|uniref:Uncharacterized protein n=1 Tax=Polaribacter butkevichii TaxID=218490 RepID=A0A2P6CE23_9FLAO|nr:hypothetical protein [Polaribacter butkevichii]PQJ73153.1 hypothetical protein BTO14_07735 [Polaribacter butkevichii]